MNTYYLCRLKEMFFPGRVVIMNTLPTETNGIVIRMINAPHWGKAREKVNDFEFNYKEGYGYF